MRGVQQGHEGFQNKQSRFGLDGVLVQFEPPGAEGRTRHPTGGGAP